MTEQPDDPVLTRTLRDHASYFKAPADLHFALKAELRREDARAKPTKMPLKWPSLFAGHWASLGAAFALGLLVSLAGVGMLDRAKAPEADLIALASDHARAVVTNTTIAVVSSDQHTVKPWLSRELGVSPLVIDLTSAGFPLRGGRKGYLGGAAVPVMVYAYKEHTIDLYALADTGEARPLADRHVSINGYHCLAWHEDGFTYVAVSDVDSERLKGFADLLKHRQPSAD